MRIPILVATLVTIFHSITTNAQTTEQDVRLKARFNDNELVRLRKEAPAEVDFWDYFAQKGFVVFKIDGEKGASELTTIDFSGDLATINPLNLGLEPKQTEVQTFALGTTGHGIMILSRTKIQAKMARKD